MKVVLIAICTTLAVFGCSAKGPAKTDTTNIEKINATKTTCHGKPTVIAVVDTGFGVGWAGEESVKLCKFGHKNFVDESDTSDKFGTKVPVPVDKDGHGTHIASIIDAFAKAGNINYCIVVLKYWNPKAWGNENLENSVKAIEYAKRIKADFINFSGGGPMMDDSEQKAVKSYLDAGGRFVAAAGNEKGDLEKFPYYPAMEDDRVVVVGALESDKKTHAKYSNFGKRVNRWEPGEVISLHYSMHGTSQATAVATGKLVVETKNTCK